MNDSVMPIVDRFALNFAQVVWNNCRYLVRSEKADLEALVKRHRTELQRPISYIEQTISSRTLPCLSQANVHAALDCVRRFLQSTATEWNRIKETLAENVQRWLSERLSAKKAKPLKRFPALYEELMSVNGPLASSWKEFSTPLSVIVSETIDSDIYELSVEQVASTFYEHIVEGISRCVYDYLSEVERRALSASTLEHEAARPDKAVIEPAFADSLRASLRAAVKDTIWTTSSLLLTLQVEPQIFLKAMDEFVLPPECQDMDPDILQFLDVGSIVRLPLHATICREMQAFLKTEIEPSL